MNDLTWVDWAQGIGAVATPLLVAFLAYMLTRRQSRNGELVSARLDYYRVIVPDLNDLMCYVTFIGSWRDMAPPQVISIKRRLDKNFYCAAPLFTAEVAQAYDDFMSACFQTFNSWGQDAVLLTSAYRRRQSYEKWDRAWDGMFAYPDDRVISQGELADLRLKYDRLLISLVKDIDITRTRASYTGSSKLRGQGRLGTGCSA